MAELPYAAILFEKYRKGVIATGKLLASRNAWKRAVASNKWPR
ncbi:MAG: hypothetical protein A4E40_00796 [Methanoregulaceae archaeon PtaU1.Bin059]|nr:MAG: hypothetical protein A4E39_01932 [Methanoregulaceae archaeon PtaB.Bin152]OPY40568.1 MAG: hypothetical protein A4E40_00796 [Methanoregulaceae archaeon PtaU1.Bin059]